MSNQFNEQQKSAATIVAMVGVAGLAVVMAVAAVVVAVVMAVAAVVVAVVMAVAAVAVVMAVAAVAVVMAVAAVVVAVVMVVMHRSKLGYFVAIGSSHVHLSSTTSVHDLSLTSYPQFL